MKISAIAASMLGAILLTSCSTYVTPAEQADLRAVTQSTLKAAYQARPAIKFPANLAVVRVQEGNYRAFDRSAVGSGAYSVLLGVDKATQSQMAKLENLPGLDGVVRLNRLLLPSSLSSDLELREAAAKLHADAVLIYTVSTEFRDRNVIAPLTTLSLGLAPNKRYQIHSTASGLLMDTKTGYLYGALEESDSKSGMTMAWGSRGSIENARFNAEQQAVLRLLESFDPLWKRVHARHK